MAPDGNRCRRRRRSQRSTWALRNFKRYATACGWWSTRLGPAAQLGSRRLSVSRIAGHDVSGKTGSAQVISNTGRASARTTKNLRDHGFFVFFAPRDNPKIAGVVFVEHGIHGGNAARIAHHILDTFFAKQDGRPLPPPPTQQNRVR